MKLAILFSSVFLPIVTLTFAAAPKPTLTLEYSNN